MDFNQAIQFYAELKQQYDMGRIPVEEFERRINEVIVKDGTGVEWQIGVSSGKWYRFDGKGWVEDTPPGFKSFSTPAAVSPPAFTSQPTLTPQGQRESGTGKWLIGLLIVGVLGLCCIVLVVGGWLFYSRKIQNPAVPPAVSTIAYPTEAILTEIPILPPVTEATPAPTASPAPLAEPAFPSDLVQFQDDFSDPGSGWGTNQDANGMTDYSNGTFRINVMTTDYLLWSYNYQVPQNDITIQVDATKAGGPDDNAFGVICRYQDSDNFYYFVITSDGYAGIAMYKNNEKIWLSGEKLLPSDAILQGAATNRIRADCAGSTLTLYANETEIVSVTDSSFTGGNVGLIAKAYATPGVDILFDNFIVMMAGY